MPVEAIGWLLLIFILVIAGFLAVTYLRKRLQTDEDPAEGSAFTLGDLRNLVKQGKLTQEEYDRLRAGIVAAAKKDAPDPLARPDRTKPRPGQTPPDLPPIPPTPPAP